MNVELLHKKIKGQGAEAESNMKKAVSIAPLRLSRWLNSPDREPLEAEELDQLKGWALGEYGRCSTTEGYIRVRPKAGARVTQSPAHPPYDGGPSPYRMGTPAGPTALTPAKNKGADIPEPDDLKIAAAKAKEQAERKAREVGPIKRMTEVLPLMTFGRSHA